MSLQQSHLFAVASHILRAQEACSDVAYSRLIRSIKDGFASIKKFRAGDLHDELWH